MDVVRDRGSLFRETEEGLIENTYTLKIINKSQQAQRYKLAVSGLEQANWLGETEITIAGGDTANVPISLAVDPVALSKPMTDIEFSLENSQDPSIRLTQRSNFFSAR